MAVVDPVTEKNESLNEENHNYYDEILATLPKQSAFMTLVRRWEKRMGFQTPIIWTNAFFIFLIHIGTIVYTAYYFYSGNGIKKETLLFAFLYYIFTGFGAAGGVHRLWSHRAFKVTKPLQIITMMAYAGTGQNPIRNWVRDHRVHHKKVDTNSDPHNINRGFFFAHYGWLMMKRHPHFLAEAKKIDMRDITEDKLIMWFDDHFTPIKIFFCFILPTVIPMVLFGETLGASIIQTFVRYLILLNGMFSVNSFAHYFGNRPYNKNIKPTQNYGVNVVTLGEGSHNFHHEFAWDYKSTENPMFSLVTIILNVLMKTGMVYDAREASQSLVDKVKNERGDSRKRG